MDIDKNHPLVGVWVTEEDDSSAIFDITVNNGIFSVSGEDRMDHEEFQIKNVSWDGVGLSFESKMLSTGHAVEHKFIAISKNEIRHEYTLTEKWVRYSS